MSTVSVSITGPDPDWLAEHARALVDARLAACGNIIPTIRSIYRWQDAVEDEAEAYVILQTQRHTCPRSSAAPTNPTHMTRCTCWR